MKILKRNFYNQNTLKVAKDLLGCFLMRKAGGKIIKSVITETEAYMGGDDLASHASRGRTPRTELMFGEAGRAYIYMIYGMYHCLNVVTEKKDFPAAVLIRGVYPVKSPTSRGAKQFNRVKIEDVEYKKTNGPGKLCKVLKIDRKLNGLDITKGEKLWIEKGNNLHTKIVSNKRVGIDYAKHCREYLWRFTLNDYVKK